MRANDASNEYLHHSSMLASVGQMAAGIAHEVRNPLTAVKGFLQLLQKQSPHNYLDIAQQELDNAISIMQNLLSVSKPDMDNEPLQKLRLCVEFDALLNLFQDKVYKVKIERQYSHMETEILGKKNQLKKAFFNLLKNAFEAIPDSGVVTVGHTLKDKHVHIKISDTGVGIPQEKLMLLGTPFFTTKEEGTGMGLAQVFSTIYQHGGAISVESEPLQGTTFAITFPVEYSKTKEVAELNLQYSSGDSLEKFMQQNRIYFENRLLEEAVNLKDILKEIKEIGSIDLLLNAYRLINHLVKEQDYEIINFAKEEGQTWARHSSLNLSVKLEWFQAIRQVIWDFLYNYDRLSEAAFTREQFYSKERQINNALDTFLWHFFVSYTHFKDRLIQAHREVIDDLSVPIIPLSSSVSILPLLGSIDTHRAKIIREKVLQQIRGLQISTLLIDMSGVALLDTAVANHLFKIVDGISFMGCDAVITGIRPEIASTMVDLGIRFNDRIKTKGTLQQALEELNLRMVEPPK